MLGGRGEEARPERVARELGRIKPGAHGVGLHDIGHALGGEGLGQNAPPLGDGAEERAEVVPGNRTGA